MTASPADLPAGAVPVASPDAEREAYLQRMRDRLRAQRDGGPYRETTAAPSPPTPVHRDVKPENVAPIVSAQVSPYGDHGPRLAPSHLAHELGALVAELSADSLEVVVIVARRLARAEETSACPR